MSFIKKLVLPVAFLSCLSTQSAFANWDLWLAQKQDVLIANPATAPSGACFERYDRIFGDGELNVTLGFGYADTKPGNYVIDKLIMDGIVRALTAPCRRGVSACGFRGGPAGSFTLLKNVRGPRGNMQPVKIHFIRASVSHDDKKNMTEYKVAQTKKCQAATDNFFSSIARGPEVVFYAGHSRNGGGPDFCPGVATADNHVNYDYYRKYRPGKKKMIEALGQSAAVRNPVEVLGMISCSSSLHFKNAFSAASPETGMLLTNASLSFQEVYQDLYVSLDSLLAQRCGKKFEAVLSGFTDLSGMFVP